MQLNKLIHRWALIIITGTSGTVFAQQTDYMAMFPRTDTWEPYVDETYSYSDNLFRIPTLQINGQPVSDTSWRSEVGVTLDKTYGRQHLTGNADVNKTAFDRFKTIDYTGKDAALNWAWGLTNDFTGDLGVTYSDSLTPFSQFHFNVLSLRTQTNENLDANYLVTPEWQVHASVTKNILLYNLPIQKIGNRYQDDTTVGFDYISDAGNKIGAVLQHETGEYPITQLAGSPLVGEVFFDNNYVQNSLKANVDYTYSALTHVQLLAGWLRRNYSNFGSRDVSGPSARLLVHLFPTGKTTIDLSAWHDVSASDDITINYAISKGFGIDPVWNVTEKVRMELNVKDTTLDYSTAASFTSLLPQNRVDSQHDVILSLLYSPLRKVQFGAALYATQLNSSIANYSYRDKGLTLSARAAF